MSWRSRHSGRGVAGFMAFEATVGLVILAVVLGIFAVAANQYRSGLNEQSERRALMRSCEHVVAGLRAGVEIELADDHAARVEPVEGEQAWVRVTVGNGQREQSLVARIDDTPDELTTVEERQ